MLMKPRLSSNMFFSWCHLRAGAAVVSLALAIAGCATPTMPAKTFLDQTLGAKASFDLQCPKEQLQIVDLPGDDTVLPYGCWGEPCVRVDGQFYRLDRAVARQQGVSGCGRRASYTYVDRTWVGNGAMQAQPVAR
jgi:hypothetical protein